MKKLPPLNEMIKTKTIFKIVCILFAYNLFKSLRMFVMFFETSPGYLFNNFISIGFGFFALFGFYRLFQREKAMEIPTPIEFADDKEFIKSMNK